MKCQMATRNVVNAIPNNRASSTKGFSSSMGPLLFSKHSLTGIAYPPLGEGM